MKKDKLVKKETRQRRVRAKIHGTKDAPRLSVFRSNQSTYLQLIDDDKGNTLVSVNAKEIKKSGKKTEQAFELGKKLAAKALEKGIKKAVFDRSGHRYHGRVKMVAEGAREGGLKF
ncbi:50S ribosomal protein L18 [Candidatus Falkowbacteria bacterium]|nr:50S ribosomal protein L18 [Candidatus Falkowbacteria bacterium]